MCLQLIPFDFIHAKVILYTTLRGNKLRIVRAWNHNPYEVRVGQRSREHMIRINGVLLENDIFDQKPNTEVILMDQSLWV